MNNKQNKRDRKKQGVLIGMSKHNFDALNEICTELKVTKNKLFRTALVYYLRDVEKKELYKKLHLFI